MEEKELSKVWNHLRTAFALFWLMGFLVLAKADSGQPTGQAAFLPPTSGPIVENGTSGSARPPERKEKILYPKKTELQFEGTQIEGEIQNPGEFYFQHRPEEKFDSLIKRRKNFHREMLRDAVQGK